MIGEVADVDPLPPAFAGRPHLVGGLVVGLRRGFFEKPTAEVKSFYKYVTKVYPIVAKQLQFRLTRVNDPARIRVLIDGEER